MKEIIFENLKIQQGIDFGKLTTIKISGKAHFFTVVKILRTRLSFQKKIICRFLFLVVEVTRL